MTHYNTIKRSIALFASIGSLFITAISYAHEADCPYCKLKLVQNTKDQDNEVVMKMGNKKIEYRCLYCVFKDQGRYKSDLVVYAPSEKVGEPVILKRTAGKWSAPEGAVFINSFKAHTDCAELSRAFHSKAGLEDFAKRKGIVAPKAMTLDEFIEQIKKPIGG